MTRFIWPVQGAPVITRDFYYQAAFYVGGQHMALDFGYALTKPYLAVADGTVVTAGGWDGYSGYFVALDHTGGWRSIYRHASPNVAVSVGQSVVQGQVVAYSGNTGSSTGPHLHFDLWNAAKQSDEAIHKNGWWAHDPALYLGKEEGMASKEYEILKTRIKKLEDKQGGNVSFRRRVAKLVSKAAMVGYGYSKSEALSRLNSVIADATDLKSRIESGQSVP